MIRNQKVVAIDHGEIGNIYHQAADDRVTR